MERQNDTSGVGCGDLLFLQLQSEFHRLLGVGKDENPWETSYNAVVTKRRVELFGQALVAECDEIPVKEISTSSIFSDLNDEWKGKIETVDEMDRDCNRQIYILKCEQRRLQNKSVCFGIDCLQGKARGLIAYIDEKCHIKGYEYDIKIKSSYLKQTLNELNYLITEKEHHKRMRSKRKQSCLRIDGQMNFDDDSQPSC